MTAKENPPQTAPAPVQRATDEYVPVAVSVLPESVTLATLNEQNRSYWKNAGNPNA